MSKLTKQVIVVRTKYPDGKGGTFKIRAGKLIAQACHASMAFLTNHRVVYKDSENDPYYPFTFEQVLSNAQDEWLNSAYRKIVCYVETEQELTDIYLDALKAGLVCHLIEDNGLTEFHGVKTKTAVAIGPGYSDDIDPITKDLKLY